jgi:CheY-like chemotaxis protein
MEPDNSVQQHLLLVEDDDDDFLIFSLALKGIHLPVTLERVGSGKELIDHLKNDIPDILFMDIMMPCQTGIDCLKEIRKNPKYDALLVIMYSAFNDTYTIKKCFLERANLYAIKPDTIGELSDILKSILLRDWKKKSAHYPMLSDFLIKSEQLA